MLITFEGVDASGKSTQLELLEIDLRKKGIDVIVTRQPGGSQIGQQIRKVILDPDNSEMLPETEVLLYMADRLQHLGQVIRPALDEGKIILCDRYHDALIVYQGAGRGMELDWLKPIEEKYLIRPDLTFWFDVSLEESQYRMEKRNRLTGDSNCRLESEDISFFERVIAKYRELNEAESDRYIRISAEENRENIKKQILDILIPKIENGR